MAKNNPNQLKLALPPGKVSAHPTKTFFVQMLTRDIDLMDAIMDLIDNCLDGVHRSKKKSVAKGAGFYKGFHASIEISPNKFVIKDNCGGIPEDVAKHYAFKLGRDPQYNLDKDLETVGVYGIGMKRAIFKIGNEANVLSHHQASCFEVTVPKDWIDSDGWYFDFVTKKKVDIKSELAELGTSVTISKIHSGIKERFADKAGFLKDLRTRLKEHYGYIIHEGFTLTLNGVAIEEIALNIIAGPSTGKSKKGISPFVYSAEKDQVSIEICIGFYRPPAEHEEVEKSLDGSFARATAENAGVTVLCNDRVVLYANKDILTGWGEYPVPSYHAQFINIAGVVHFRSKLPFALPVTTTKRGLDTSSEVYYIARNNIREGLRLFTSFTNNWKAASEERTELFKNVKKINALIPGNAQSNFKMSKSKKDNDGKYHLPDLPKPANTVTSSKVAITFNREKSMVEEIKQHFTKVKNKSANEIGAWCFDEIHSQIER